MKNKTIRKIATEVIETFKKAKEFEKQLHDLKKITKKNAPEFIATYWLIERDNVPDGLSLTKSERITITIEMKSSGNTSSMSGGYILQEVRNKLNSIS